MRNMCKMESWKTLCLAFVVFLALRIMEVTGQRVVQLGNPLIASASGIDELPQAGVIFLMHDVILTEGVVFAISAFFRSNKPVRLQIWRPRIPNPAPGDNTAQDFDLLYELKVTPSVIHQREDIYIVSRFLPCVLVKEGDRLGVHLQETPGAVAYKFDDAQPAALGHTFRQRIRPILINETVSFDLLRFPYDFSLAAYIDTDLSQYKDLSQILQPCPARLLIPDHLKPTLPTLPPTSPMPTTTPIPGATGPVGPAGKPGTVTGPKGPDGFPGLPGPAGKAGKAGPQGPNGLGDVKGPLGDAGPQGSPGPAGVKGPTGEVGDRGPTGPSGQTGKRVKVVDGREVEIVSASELNKSQIIVATIWLIVVTVIVIIIIIIICAIKRSDQRYYRERLPPRRKKGSPEYAYDNEAMIQKDEYR